MANSNPIARDFHSPTRKESNRRPRALTHAAASTPAFSLDVEKGPRRHNTLSPSTHFEPASSLPGLQGKINRTNTIRGYHVDSQHAWQQPGAEPGVDPLRDAISNFSLLQQRCQITLVDYSEERVQRHDFDNDGFIDFIQKPREDWVACRWVNVNGLSWDVIRALGTDQKLHRLAIEDLLSSGGRTKADFYRDHCFVLLTLQKLIRLPNDENPNNRKRKRWWSALKSPKESEHMNGEILGSKLETVENTIPPSLPQEKLLPVGDGTRTLQRYRRTVNPERALYMERNSALTKRGMAVSVEQVSVFLTQNNTVISFFEHSADDIEEPILKRLEDGDTILRRSEDSSMLLQSVIDAIVDLAAPVTAAYEGKLTSLQGTLPALD